jgi:hypothetical protein
MSETAEYISVTPDYDAMYRMFFRPDAITASLARISRTLSTEQLHDLQTQVLYPLTMASLVATSSAQLIECRDLLSQLNKQTCDLLEQRREHNEQYPPIRDPR